MKCKMQRNAQKCTEMQSVYNVEKELKFEVQMNRYDIRWSVLEDFHRKFIYNIYIIDSLKLQCMLIAGLISVKWPATTLDFSSTLYFWPIINAMHWVRSWIKDLPIFVLKFEITVRIKWQLNYMFNSTFTFSTWSVELKIGIFHQNGQ